MFWLMRRPMSVFLLEWGLYRPVHEPWRYANPFGGAPRGTEQSAKFPRPFPANADKGSPLAGRVPERPDRGKSLSGAANVPRSPNERVRRGGVPDREARRRTG